MARLALDAEDRLLEFALIQQTRREGQWLDVLEADSKHGSVHVHRLIRSTCRRVGQPEVLKRIERLADVQDGYNQAYSFVVDNWREQVRRWNDG